MENYSQEMLDIIKEEQEFRKKLLRNAIVYRAKVPKEQLIKNGWEKLADNTNELIVGIANQKATDLYSKRFTDYEYLPKILNAEQLKIDILKTNKKIISISDKYSFFREHEFVNPEVECSNDVLFRLCRNGLNENEYKEYLNLDISEDDSLLMRVTYFIKLYEHVSNDPKFEINLPKFELITDYLALLKYFDDLVYAYNEVEKGHEIPPPQTRYQLQTKLNDTQRGKLFDLLVLHEFITDKNKAGFIWALGGEQTQPIDWQPIEWIDKSITRKEPNIQTLFELLYLLGVDKDTSANNPKNLYRKMEFCFSGLKNIAAKNPTTIQQKTERQRLLKTIIEEVKKVEAQK